MEHLSGNQVMRDTFLPFALPDVDDAELLQIKEALDSGWVTTGPKTRQFEAEFAAAVGARHAVAVNSCTAAMHLALEAIGLQRGDEVIIPAYTFASTAEVVRYFDARPVLVDVDPRCLNVDPAQIEAAISPRTKAIIPVHIAGLPAEMDAIAAIAARHHLAIVEDAAHAFPARYKGRMIGSAVGNRLAVTGDRELEVEEPANDGNLPPAICHLPHTACFSFYATKTLTTGEGGMITTDDDALAERCHIMALHGISKDAWKRYTANGSWYYEIIAPGYKYNMTDIAAGMGLAQLAKVERMWRRRKEIVQRYNAAFGKAPALQVPHDREDCQHAWHLYMLRLHLDQLRIDRAQFMEELKQRHIGASVHFIPLHLHPYYRETYGYRPEDFPVAYGEYLREVSLPIYSRMSDHDVQDVIDAVLAIVNAYAG
jgi:dTDP-4-amino-4,6-dideoxygalactose transaminase